MLGIELLLEAVRRHGPDRQAYHALGAINAFHHPDGEHLIFSYTDAAAVRGEWNPVERVARGLIVHWPSVRVVGRPFDKFFNLNELPETRLENLPTGPLEVTAKIDGSLGILYRAHDGYAIATRGSFTGLQAQWATRHLRAHYDLTGLPEDVTLLFEIVYPTNRVVVDYGQTEELVLIGARQLDGFDYPHADLEKIGTQFGFPVVEAFTSLSLEELMEQAQSLRGIEGWVVRCADGLRVKVKTRDYVRLSRALNQLRPEVIRDMLREGPGTWASFRSAVPAEYGAEVDGLAAAINAQVDAELARLQAIMAELLAGPGGADRRSFAIEVMKTYKREAPYLFVLYDGREVRSMALRFLDLATVALPGTGGGFRRFVDPVE